MISSRTAREKLARGFLGIHGDWFDDPANAFHGTREIAERLLDEWAGTGDFPMVQGMWIRLETKFEEWMAMQQ